LAVVENLHRTRQAVRNIKSFLRKHGADGPIAAARTADAEQEQEYVRSA
jgi:hypothetical protein